MHKNLIFSFFSLQVLLVSAHAESTPQELALGIKINKGANSNTLKSLKEIERLVEQKNFPKLSIEFTYSQTKEDYPPPGSEKSSLLSGSVDITPLLSPKGKPTVGGKAPGLAGLVSVAVPLFTKSSPKALSGEARQSVYQRVHKLIDIYNNPATEPDRKQFIKTYINDYFELDVSVSNKDLFIKDQDMIEAINYGKVLNFELSNDLKNMESHLKQSVLAAEKNIITETQAIVQKVAKSMNDKMDKEFGQIGAAVQGVADVQQEHFDFVKQKAMEEEYREKLEKMTNYEEMDKEIARIQKDCAAEISTSCEFQKEQIENLQKMSEYHFRRDAGYATVQSLKMFQEFAGLIGDEKLARDFSRAVYVAETGQKMMDLALKIGMQSSLASIGDVTSMAGMAMSVMSMFGGGGDSSDAQIMAELQKIRKAIQELREEMHERFDQLSAQLQSIGLSLDLKTQSIDEKLFVVLDNQQMIESLIRESHVSILDLTDLVANQQLKTNLDDMITAGNEIKLNNKPSIVHTLMSGVTSTFLSYFEYSDFLSMNWMGAQNTVFDMNSDKAVQVISSTSASSPQRNFVNFTLVDYLMKSSTQKSLGGDCSAIDFNQVYLFNLLGAALLPSLRANYNNKDTLILEDKNKYLSFLKIGKLDEEQAIYNLQSPLLRVDSLINIADTCLNTYARDEEGNTQNIFAYLLKEYGRLFKEEVNKVIKNVEEGRAKIELQKAIKDTTQGYLRDYDGQFMSLDAKEIGLRAFIDLDAVPYFPSADLESSVSDIFYEKFKIIPSCNSMQENIPEIAKQFAPIEMPRVLLNKIFTSTNTKLSILMGLNPMKVCYLPARIFEKKEVRDSPLVKIMNLELFSTVGHPSGMWSGKGAGIDFSLTIPVFLPRSSFDLQDTTITKIDTYFEDFDNRETFPGFAKKPRSAPPGEPILIEKQVPAWKINDESYVNDVSIAFQKTAWDCKTVVEESISSCRPSDVPDTDSYFVSTLKKYEKAVGGELAKGYTEKLKAAKATEIYNKLRNELALCSRQMLMGYNRCEFRGFKSAESLSNLMNLKEVNNINAVLELLVPMLSTFRDGMSDEEKKAFILDFEKTVQPALSIIFETSYSEGDIVNNFRERTDKVQKDLETLAERANRDLYIDTKSILDTDVYDALKFYLELTEQALQ